MRAETRAIVEEWTHDRYGSKWFEDDLALILKNIEHYAEHQWIWEIIQLAEEMTDE